jgi:hypothetical protein
MRKLGSFLVVGLLLAFSVIAINAQTTGSISGTVTDQAGAIVPGANITITSEAGQRFAAVTNSSGYYNVPGVAAGAPTYTVTVTAPNFKTLIVRNVKVDVGTPVTVNGMLEAGDVSAEVVVTSGGEVLQSETATVGTSITGRQILETPIQSRDALDLVALLPGTATVGTIRTSSINGLPKSAITIQIDGVDVQDNFLKSSDGFFTFIRPRIDAIDEVTVSTSNPGAESSGDGAIGIRFVTRRGTNDYKGSGFWQHRDEGLNTANFQNNYLRQNKSKLRLNQFGFSAGGPIPFLNFGEGVKAINSGKNKRFFFVNYERFHLNEGSQPRTRTTLVPEAQGGLFRYGVGGVNSVNLFTLAQGAGLPNTIDPTVNSMLNLIQSATSSGGAFQAVGGQGTFNTRAFVFSNSAQQRRRFLTVRGDANITKNHAVDVIFNDQPFRSTGDFLNNQDSTFPGINNFGSQFSDRRSMSLGFRSNFGSSVVNQFRYAQLAGWLGGGTRFGAVTPESFFDETQRGFNIALGSGLTGLTAINNDSARTSPTRDFTNTLTWVKGKHTLQFGGQLKNIKTDGSSRAITRPTVSFGYLGEILDDPRIITAFSATSMPGASTAEVAQARALYATLTGRVSGYSGNATLGPDGRYVANGTRNFIIEEETNGLFVQDTWRFRNNLQITGGVRWQPTLGAKLVTAGYALLTNPATMAYDVSGYGNSFSPGTLTGQVPTYTGAPAGSRAYNNDLNNFAPSIGVVWSPNFNGLAAKIFGRDGTGVFRGGFSRSFVREGTFLVEGSIGLHPGASFPLVRTPTSPDPTLLLTVGTLFRDPGNPNLTPPTFNPLPVFPRPVNANLDTTVAFEPNLKTGYVDSWSVGYQRQFGRDTVVEFRYVGNRGKDMHLFYSVNEVNAIENGFGAEFRLAQQNLFANIAAGRGANFRFFGPGTGTSPLPIILSYFQGGNPDPNSPANYGSALFQNATFLNSLNPAAPSPRGMINTLDFNFRANSVANGRPVNFAHTCPNTFGFCFLVDNSEISQYDAGVIEVRRRLSAGLRFQASYVYGKAFTNAFAAPSSLSGNVAVSDQRNIGSVSLRNKQLDKSFAQIDIRHAFKADATWDLPFGRGRQFLSGSNWFVNGVLGGWTITPTLRWQSGSPVLMSNIQLVGMDAKELQKSVGVYYNQVIRGVTVPVSWLPADIIENTIRAHTTATPSATNTTGYALVPSGRFIAPAGYNNCQATFEGQCGFRKFVLYGPSFFKIDSSVGKKFGLGERRNVEIRATFFDVLNRTNWRLGGWTGNVNNITAFTGTFGQMGNGWAFNDPAGSNDPGGRITDLLIRINW